MPLGRWLFCFLLSFLLFSVSLNAKDLAGLSASQIRAKLKKINKAISSTKFRIRNSRDARYVADLYMALADFYMDKYRHSYALKGILQGDKEDEKIDLKEEQQIKAEAISTFQTVIDKFPRYKNRDKAMFFKAHEEQDLGLYERMVASYEQLVSTYKNSRYRDPSLLILGNYYFSNQKDFEQAAKKYRAIVQRSRGKVAQLAHYKLGWCYINLDRFENAFESFEAALKDKAAKGYNEFIPSQFRSNTVKHDALMAMVWPYSEITPKRMAEKYPGREDFLNYYYRLSTTRYDYEKVLLKLAKRMKLKKRDLDAAKSFEMYLRVAQNPDERMSAVEPLYFLLKEKKRLTMFRHLPRSISQTVVDMRLESSLGEDLKKKAYHDFEIFTRDLITQQHQRAQKVSTKKYWAVVVENYEWYLRAFPQSKFIDEIRQNLAESHFKAGYFLDAAKLYENLALAEEVGHKSKSLLESSIESYIDALRRQSKFNKLEKLELRVGLREVGAEFIKRYPGDRVVPDVTFNIAQTYYDERDFKTAKAKFKDFIFKFSYHEKVPNAVSLYLDIFKQEDDSDGLIKAANEVLGNGKIRNTELRQTVRQIVQQAEIRKIESNSKNLSQDSYATQFLQIASKYKGTQMGEQAMLKAFQTFKQQGSPKALQIGEQFILSKGSSRYAKKVTTEIGQMALKSANFRKAALYFELFFDKYRTDPDAKTLLNTAAELRQSMGQLKFAKRNYQKLGDNYNTARMDFLANDWSALQKSSASASGISRDYWRGMSEYRLFGIGRARPFLANVAAYNGSAGTMKDMKAHSLFILQGDLVSDFNSVRMVAGKEQQSIAAKTSMLKKLESGFQTVIALGNPKWTVGSLYEQGRIYKEFAEFIGEASPPSQLTEAQKQQYLAALKAQSGQFLQKAQGYFQQCLSVASKYKILSQFVLGCKSRGQLEVKESSEFPIPQSARAADPPGVVAAQQKLLKNPKDISVLRDIAQLYAGSRDYSLAQMVLGRLLELRPGDARALAEIGATKIFQNRPMEAQSYFQKAVKSNSKQPLALYGLKGLYGQFGFSSLKEHYQAKVKGLSAPQGAFFHPIMSR